MDFEPISTLEEFQERVREAYGDVEDLQGRISTLQGTCDAQAATITQLQAQVDGYVMADMRRSAASQKGLPPDMAERLRGTTEQELLADAETLAAALRAIKGPAPLADPTKPAAPAAGADLSELLRNLRGE